MEAGAGRSVMVTVIVGAIMASSCTSHPVAKPAVQTQSVGAFSVSQGSPAGTLLAFAKTLERQDFKAAASMIAGGDKKFDYRRMRGNIPEFERSKVQFRVTAVRANGDSAVVDFVPVYDGSGGGAEHVSMTRENGVWTLVPHDPIQAGTKGDEFESFLIDFVRPEATVVPIEQRPPVGRNLTPFTIRLGRDRAVLLQAIEKASEGHDSDGGDAPYSGYRVMSLDVGTSIMFPAGRGDEVFFSESAVGASASGILTRWKVINGKARRLWQIKEPAGLKKLMGVRHGYACYTECSPIESYYCGFSGGSEDPKSPTTDDPILQGTLQARSDGFFILPAEMLYVNKHR